MKSITLYYIPFYIQTYTPVTSNLIEKQAYCTFHISSSDNLASSLKEILNNTTTGNFDNTVVRLKIVRLYHDDVYIDIEGGVYRAGQERKLPSEAFEQLKKYMTRLKMENPKSCRI